MAVAKSGKRGNEQGKRTGKMGGEKASGLRRVAKTRLANQCEDEIMDVCQHSGAMTNCEASRIFLEGNIPSIM